jgi:AcrR family transcriptional regulator
MNRIQVTSDPLAELRRTPKQERSRALVETVLDTTDGLLADGIHPAELTTTKIAAAAGVSVGAVYQYFSDTEAIVAAVAARHIDASSELMDAAVETIGADPDPVGTMVDLFAARYRAEPGYRALWFGPHLNARLQAADRAGKETIADGVRRAFAATRGDSGPAGLSEQQARAAVFAVDSLLQEAFRRDPAGDPGLLEEAKTMMRAYLPEVAPGATDTERGR